MDELPIVKCADLVTQAFTEEFSELIVREAVTFLSQSYPRSKWSLTLRQAINQTIKVPGYRMADKLPTKRIITEILKTWRISDHLAGAVFGMWAEAQAALLSQVRPFLEDLGVPLMDDSYLHKGAFVRFINRDTFEVLATQFIAAYPDMASEDEVKLAIALATGSVFVSSEDYESFPDVVKLSIMVKEKAMTLWKRWLEELRQLAADADEWQSWEEFLQEANVIVAEKKAQHLAQTRHEALEAAITAFQNDQSQWIAFFGLAGCHQWAASNCPLELIEETQSLLSDFNTLLDHYAALETHQAKTLAEKRVIDQERAVLEDRVLKSYELLNTRLCPSMSGIVTPGPTSENTGTEGGSEDTGSFAAVETEASIEEPPAEAKPVMAMPIAAEAPLPDIVTDEGVPVAEANPNAFNQNVMNMGQNAISSTEEDILARVESQPHDQPLSSETYPEVEETSSASDEDDQDLQLEAEGLTGPDLILAPPAGTLPDETASGIETEAMLVPVEVPEEKVAERMLQLITEGDLSGAYWLAWAQEAQGQASPLVPSWLLAALQGQFWAVTFWPASTAPLLLELSNISRQNLPVDSQAQQIFGIAAALPLALLDPAAGWVDWLNVADLDAPHLNELISAVRTFTQRAWPLQRDEITGLQSEESLRVAVEIAASEARQWLEQAALQHTNYQRATDVWWELLKLQTGEVYQWMDYVARDQRSERESVRAAITQWRDRKWVDQRIQEIDRYLKGRKRDPIVGTALNLIIRWIGQACDIAEEWVEAVNRCEQFLQSDDWSRKIAQDLVQQLQIHIPEARVEIQSIPNDPSALETVAYELLVQTLDVLEQWLSNAEVVLRPRYCPSTYKNGSLFENLTYRLYWLPDIPLSDDSTLLPEAAPCVITVFADPARCNPELPDVLQQYYRKHDYRWVNVLLESSSDQAASLRSIGREAFRCDLKQLEQELVETTTLIERALIDFSVDEDKDEMLNADSLGIWTPDSRARQDRATRLDATRSEELGRLEVIAVHLDELSHDEADIPAVNLSLAFKRLRDKRRQLVERRKERAEHLRHDWESYQFLLERQAIDEHQLQEVRMAMERALNRGELRTAQEYLVHLRDVVQGGRPLEAERFIPIHEEDYLSGFLAAQDDLRCFLDETNLMRLSNLILSKKAPKSLELNHLPRPRLQEVAGALSAWSQLKDTGGVYFRQDDRSQVLVLLRYLGFTITSNSPLSSIITGRSNFQRWRLQAQIPEGLAPVPQFGSDAQGAYDIMGAWERPGFNLIGSVLSEKIERPVILFYFARLLPRQREDLMRLTRSRSGKLPPVMVIDEVLLLFLAREYDNRLKRLFPVALPYGTINPYVPFAAGSVPPEMFVGRGEESAKLRDPRGPAIVYGGRQLGKSALLRYVQREFHNPAEEHYAILEDIKELGDPCSGQEYERAFLNRMVAAFQRIGLLKSQNRPASIEKFVDALKLSMFECPDRYVLLLLDESDKFLEADADREFRLVSELKRLMDDTNRRFKVVLAGLHNVQRYERLSNQPLAHLGDPILIGPLDYNAARELVRRPLRALGYRFGDPRQDDPALILQILSYTNYHPALIQLFCYHLLEHMRTKTIDKLPYIISKSDIEQVYRKDEVRRQIRERFNLTISLDERYEVIALALILDQWEQHNGFDRAYTPQEIYEQASGWWEQGFRKIKDDRFKGYLEEMCGLGILSRQADGGYRLRSPNLIHLMGSKHDLEERLETICAKQPPLPLILESHHAVIDPEAAQYSPLTFAEMRIVDAPRSGACLLFGSKAAGMGKVKPGLRYSAQKDDTSRVWEELKSVACGAGVMERLLQEIRQRNSAARHILIHRDLAADSEAQIEQVTAAIRFCARYPRAEIRVVLALDPLAAWNWFSIPEQQRIEIERQLDVISLSLWDEVGIRQLLEFRELPSDDAVCQNIQRVTGGWDFLLGEFFSNLSQGEVIRSYLNKFEHELTTPQSSIARGFFASLEIPKDSLPWSVLNAIRREKSGVYQSLVAPILLENVPEDAVNAALDYLVRMSIVHKEVQSRREPLLIVDPVILRLWTDDER